MNELEWQCQSQMNEDPIARRVNQVRITKSSRTRKQKIAKAENHNITTKHRENLEWNTDLIEMMEIKHVMSQAAQDLDDGETRHESREAEAREQEEVQ